MYASHLTSNVSVHSSPVFHEISCVMYTIGWYWLPAAFFRQYHYKLWWCLLTWKFLGNCDYRFYASHAKQIVHWFEQTYRIFCVAYIDNRIRFLNVLKFWNNILQCFVSIYFVSIMLLKPCRLQYTDLSDKGYCILLRSFPRHQTCKRLLVQ